MSKGKWTPGPWKTFTDGERYTIKDRNSLKLCSIIPMNGRERRYDAECHATARLISASPEMFEALEEMEEYLDQRADADQPPGYDAPIGNEEMRLLMTVRSALSKARGE